jgi:FKBP-type peptidyl-prolyl cis-trans isomerase
MPNKKLLTLFALIFGVFGMIACDDSTNPYEQDFSTVPDLADTTAAINKWVTDSGVTVYLIEEGDSTDLQIGIRDQIDIWFTSRTETGTIIQSTYANGFTSSFSVANMNTQTSIYYVQEHLPSGLIGMYIGEHRVLVFPDELTTAGTGLVIDVQLEAISY